VIVFFDARALIYLIEGADATVLMPGSDTVVARKIGADEPTALQGSRAKNALLAVADGGTVINQWRQAARSGPWQCEKNSILCGRYAIESWPAEDYQT
jgi:hypothetical protein